MTSHHLSMSNNKSWDEVATRLLAKVKKFSEPDDNFLPMFWTNSAINDDDADSSSSESNEEGEVISDNEKKSSTLSSSVLKNIQRQCDGMYISTFKFNYYLISFRVSKSNGKSCNYSAKKSW